MTKRPGRDSRPRKGEKTPEAPRCAVIALLGAPNAGKSTFVNRAVGGKVSIVTPKAQTTRCCVRGIAMRGAAQLVFIDTPGIFQPSRRLDQAMVRAAWASIEGSDFCLVLADASRGGGTNTAEILASLKRHDARALLLLNKVDAAGKPSLLALAESLNREHEFERIFMISSLTGDGVSDVLDYLSGNAPEGPYLYPPDQISDLPRRMFAAEITREQVMLRLRQELPYVSMVETESWEEGKEGVRIRQVIYVTRENHKRIVVGKGGETLRGIGEASRKELSRLLGRKAHLFLFVKVKENWQDSAEHFRDMGLEFE